MAGVTPPMANGAEHADVLVCFPHILFGEMLLPVFCPFSNGTVLSCFFTVTFQEFFVYS